MRNREKKFIGRHLMVKGKYVEDILTGKKKATIRKGIVVPKYEEIIVHGGGKPVAKIKVTKVTHKRLHELTNEDALKDGFKNKEELIRELKRVYLELTDNDWVTIIEFDLVQRLDHLEPEHPYLGLTPADIARLGLRYLDKELSQKDKQILLDLTRTNSIRMTALRLFGTLNKRYIIRKVLRKTLEKLVEKGVIKTQKKHGEK
ncbi:MAG: ASCH domain-containing protein [Staphylothermus sp.]|nr:ASCH domain-containing protein [Staphylothermus sp.]